jgi:protein involved in ribonucleotide reduction
MVVRSKSEATVFCLTRDKYSQNYTFTWLRQFEGNNNSPEVCPVLIIM